MSFLSAIKFLSVGGVALLVVSLRMRWASALVAVLTYGMLSTVLYTAFFPWADNNSIVATIEMGLLVLLLAPAYSAGKSYGALCARSDERGRRVVIAFIRSLKIEGTMVVLGLFVGVSIYALTRMTFFLLGGFGLMSNSVRDTSEFILSILIGIAWCAFTILLPNFWRGTVNAYRRAINGERRLQPATH